MWGQLLKAFLDFLFNIFVKMRFWKDTGSGGPDKNIAEEKKDELLEEGGFVDAEPDGGEPK